MAGADPAAYAGWDGPYDVRITFHEPMLLYGYLAAVTSMELVTGDQPLRASGGFRSRDLVLHVKPGFWNVGSRPHLRMFPRKRA